MNENTIKQEVAQIVRKYYENRGIGLEKTVNEIISTLNQQNSCDSGFIKTSSDLMQFADILFNCAKACEDPNAFLALNTHGSVTVDFSNYHFEVTKELLTFSAMFLEKLGFSVSITDSKIIMRII